jgi:hypothetical protein
MHYHGEWTMIKGEGRGAKLEGSLRWGRKKEEA